MRLTNLEIVSICEAAVSMEDIVLDNARGMALADLHAALLPQAQAYQMRQKALQKERKKLLDDHAVKDNKGNVTFTNPEEPDPARRIVKMHNPDKAAAALEAWAQKADDLDSQVREVEATPLPDDFFTKPTALNLKQGIRMRLVPALAKRHASVKATGKAAKSTKRK